MLLNVKKKERKKGALAQTEKVCYLLSLSSSVASERSTENED